MLYQKNEVLTVDILDVNMKGFGVAKIDEAVFLVQNAVVGDRAKIRIIKATKKYYVARVEELMIASKHRTEPGCTVFRRCGGCAFQHISYQLEKTIKRNYVESCFRKAGLSKTNVLPVLSTEEIEGYRNKAQFPFSCDREGNVVAGFFSPKTHTVCPIKHCSIQDPLFSHVLNFVCDYFTKEKIPVYDETTGEGLLRHLYLRNGKATGEIMLCLVVNGDSLPDEEKFVYSVVRHFPYIASIVLNMNTEKTNVILGDRTRILWGKDKISDILCGNRLELSPQSFYQVNHDGAELLYETAFAMANVKKYDLILDLYCGIGSISLSASASCPIVGIEIVPEAVEDAKRNALRNEKTNTTFYCGDATDAFRIVKKIGARNPLVIVDPPRKGLAAALINDIASNGLKSVLYISCGADTLARDAKLFVDLGYEMSPVQPVDMFPRTSHVENIVCFSRKEI